MNFAKFHFRNGRFSLTCNMHVDMLISTPTCQYARQHVGTLSNQGDDGDSNVTNLHIITTIKNSFAPCRSRPFHDVK